MGGIMCQPMVVAFHAGTTTTMVLPLAPPGMVSRLVSLAACSLSSAALAAALSQPASSGSLISCEAPLFGPLARSACPSP